MSIGKWILRGVGAVVGVVAITAGAMYAKSESVISAKAVPPTRKAIVAPTDSAALALGHKLTTVNGCRECHGANLGGKVLADDPAFGRLVAPNLTSGEGGVLAHYDDRALDAAIRDGVGWDGRKLFIMPSAEYAGYADEDVAAIVADLRASAPVNEAQPAMKMGPVARALIVTGKIPFAYDLVDHSRTTLAVAPTGVTVERGKYIAAGCKGCHMQDYGGGPMPGAAPDAKPSANLTPSGNVGKWTVEEFTRIFRDGTRPDGTKVDPAMPWQALSQLSDDDVHAIYLYLRTLPPKAIASGK